MTAKHSPQNSSRKTSARKMSIGSGNKSNKKYSVGAKNIDQTSVSGFSIVS